MKRHYRGFLLIGLISASGLPVFAEEPAAPATAPSVPLPTRGEYRARITYARYWLDQLEVDPVELQTRGVKGKKKLAEILDAYLTLSSVAQDPAQRAQMLRHVASLAGATLRPEYHDMATVDDTTFKQNGTSYLRVCYLLDKFGLLTGHYRAEIEKVLPRINDHLVTRGVSQRMNFTFYYDYLSLPKPPILEEKHVEHGQIFNRKPVPAYDRMDEYNLTHEVFAAYEYGRSKQSDVFSDEDRAYLRETMSVLLGNCIDRNDYDLGAEYVSCFTYLGLCEAPIYPRAIRWILDGQNANGTWGNYEEERAKLGRIVDQMLYLHTTLVVVQCLVEAFDGDWPGALDFP